jgi:hypothetical protein
MRRATPSVSSRPPENSSSREARKWPWTRSRSTPAWEARPFTAHVADKRELALTATQGNDDRRNELFRGWHASMITTAAELLKRAQHAGAIRQDLTPRKF